MHLKLKKIYIILIIKNSNKERKTKEKQKITYNLKKIINK